MPDEFAAKPRIEIDGSPLATEFDLRLERVIVDDHLFLPDMFVLRFRDPNAGSHESRLQDRLRCQGPRGPGRQGGDTSR